MQRFRNKRYSKTTALLYSSIPSFVFVTTSRYVCEPDGQNDFKAAGEISLHFITTRSISNMMCKLGDFSSWYISKVIAFLLENKTSEYCFVQLQ